MKKQILLAAALAALVVSAEAAEKKTAILQQVQDVETLNDDLNKYANQKIQVSGEIERKIDSRSMVIESGGMLNDEIVVIASPTVKGNIASLKEDTDVTVTGTLILKPVTEIRKDYTWDLTPDNEARLKKVKAFLIADQISVKN